MTEDEVELILSIEDREAAQELRSIANEAGVEASFLRAGDPVTALALFGSGALLVGVVGRWLERLQRSGKQSWGQVIDLRPEAAQLVRRDEALEFGQIVVVVPVEGGLVEVRIETYQPDSDAVELAKLVFSTLAGGAARSMEIVAANTTAAVGDRGSVEVEPYDG